MADTPDPIQKAVDALAQAEAVVDTDPARATAWATIALGWSSLTDPRMAMRKFGVSREPLSMPDVMTSAVAKPAKTSTAARKK